MASDGGSPPPLPAAKRKSWAGRNLAWIVSGGCLLALGIGLAFTWWVVSTAFGLMRSTEVYADAVGAARASEQVRERLGEPIEEGFFFSGSIQISGGSGNASLAIPLSGPEGEGVLYVEATKSAGEWSYAVLEVKCGRTGERIDLAGEDDPDHEAEGEGEGEGAGDG